MMDRKLYQELVSTYGTPLYVLHQAKLAQSLSEIEEAFLNFSITVHIAYPYKTNPLKKLCEYMHLKGKWAEISSGLELQMALQIGVPPENIIFNSSYKSDEDLATALSLGCKLNVDNIEEFERISLIARYLEIEKVKVGMRVSPMHGSNWDKFGFALRYEAQDAIAYVSKMPEIQLVGLHTHRSNIARLKEYKAHLTEVLDFASEIVQNKLVKLEYIDIGSGFAVDYPIPIAADVWTAPTMREYTEIIFDVWQDVGLPKDICLIIEPGRRTVASCVTLLTKVVSIKERPGNKIAIVDIGHNLLPGVDLYQYLISQIKHLNASMQKVFYSMHGCLNDSLDIIGRDVPLFSLEVGEILSIGNVGGYDMARSFFWQLPRSPVVWINEDLTCDLVREKEDVNNIWQLCK